MRWRSWTLLLCAAVAMSGCATARPSAGVAGDLPAFRQVDEGYYRGGQPSPEGLRRLARMGIRTVINLRHHTTRMDEERRLAESLGMRWINIPIWYFWRPSDQQIRQFLVVATTPANRPVFVHCRQGRNRAGIMTAMYRVAYQGWEPKRAYAEGQDCGLTPWNVLTRWILLHKARGMVASVPAPSS